MNKFSEMGINVELSAFTGNKIGIRRVFDKEIKVLKYKVEESKFKGIFLTIQIWFEDEERVIFTGSKKLLMQIEEVRKDNFPFHTIIKNDNGVYSFT